MGKKFVLWSLKHLLATPAFSYTYAFYALITHYYFRGKQEMVSAFQKKNGSSRNKNPAKQLRHHKPVVISS